MTNNKRTKVLMAIPIALLIFVLASVASADGTVVVSIATDAGAAPGSTDTVPIIVDDGGDNMSFGSGIINVTYNSSVVHVTNVASASGNALTVQSGNADNTAGWVIITSMDGLEAHNGSVIFANVTYQAVGSSVGSSPLNITVKSLRNWYNYSQIPRTVSDGTFTILSGPTPTTEPPAGGGGGASYITPTPTPTSTSTPIPTLLSTLSPTPTLTLSLTPSPSPSSTPTPIQKHWIPGFEAIFAIAGLFTVAYLVLRRNKKRENEK